MRLPSTFRSAHMEAADPAVSEPPLPALTRWLRPAVDFVAGADGDDDEEHDDVVRVRPSSNGWEIGEHTFLTESVLCNLLVTCA